MSIDLCPQLGNSQVKKDFTELISIFDETAAYNLWAKNKGNHLDGNAMFHAAIANHKTRKEALIAAAKELSATYKDRPIGDFKTERDGQGLLFQSEEEAAKAKEEIDQELNSKMEQYLAEYNIPVERLTNYKDTYGGNSIAVASLLDKVIKISKGKERADTLTHEASHFAIAMLGPEHILVKTVMNNIESTNKYKEVYDSYGERYNYDVNKLKNEAAGQILTDTVMNQSEESQATLNRFQKLWKRIKQVFGRMVSNKIDNAREDALKAISDAMLTGEDIGFNEENLTNEEYYQKEDIDISKNNAFEYLFGSSKSDVKGNKIFSKLTGSYSKGKGDIYNSLRKLIKANNDIVFDENYPSYVEDNKFAYIGRDNKIHINPDVITTLNVEEFTEGIINDLNEYIEKLEKPTEEVIKEDLMEDFTSEGESPMENYLQKIINTYKGRLKTLKEQAGNRAYTEKTKKNIKDFEDKLAENKSLEAIVKYAQVAHKEMSQIRSIRIPKLNDIAEQDEIENIQEVARELRGMNDFVKQYSNQIKELHAEAARVEYNDKSTSEFKNEELAPLLKELNNSISFIEDEYIKISRVIYGKHLQKVSGRSVNEIDMVAELTEAKSDIKYLNRWVDSMSEARNDVLRLADVLWKNAAEESRLVSVSDIKRIVALDNKLKANGIKNTEWIYEMDNGEPTFNLVTEFNRGKYENARNAMFERTSLEDNPTETEKAQQRRKRGEWFSENTQDIPNMQRAIDEKKAKLIEKYGSEEGLELYQEWHDENVKFYYDKKKKKKVIYGKGELSRPAEQYRNPVYDEIVNYHNPKYNTYKHQYYELYMGMKDQKDSYYPDKYTKDGRAVMYRKDLVERLKSDNKISGVIDNFKDAFVKRADEDEFGNIKTNKELDKDAKELTKGEEMESKDYLAVYYTKELEKPSDLSLDATSSLVMHIAKANHYNEMNKIQDIMEIGRDVIGEMIVPQIEGKGAVGLIRSAFQGRAREKKKAKEGALIMQRYNDYLTMNLYGKSKKNERGAKTLDSLASFVSIKGLAANLHAGIQNIIQSDIMTHIEGIGRQFFGQEDHLYAEKLLLGNTGKVLGDIGAKLPTSKLGLWNEMFDVGQDSDSKIREIKAARGTKAERLMQTKLLMIITSLVELRAHLKASLSLANRVKLKDSKGNPINLYEAFEKVEVSDGVFELQMKEGVVKEDGSKWTTQDTIDFVKKQNNVAQDLFGIYNTSDRMALKQFMLGRQAMIFRGFMRPGINRRFRPSQHNYMTGVETEGYYRTSAKFMGNKAHQAWGFIRGTEKELRDMQFDIASKWDELSDTERANIKKTIADLGFWLVTAISIGILAGLKDDDDDEQSWAFEMIAYQANRTWTELRFYTSMNEALTILKSPSASINQIENIIELMESALVIYPLFDEIESGRYKGMTKGGRILSKNIPVYTQVRNWDAESTESKTNFFSKGSNKGVSALFEYAVSGEVK